MASRRVAGAPLDFAALRVELEVPGDFSVAAQAEADDAGQAVQFPDADATDLAFVTIDPAGSRDLDQALHIARSGGGFLVSYAIADVARFVRPGSALEAETLRRGETLYFPDVRVPLHPPSLSEGSASLLPDQVRPAVLWQIELDSSGDVVSVDVRRAKVRSRAQLDYETAQRAIDSRLRSGAVSLVEEVAGLLEEVGRLRLELARRRHAIDLNLPEEQVVRTGGRGWTLQMRQPLAVESYNAQVSVLTGMCAAQLMLAGRVGLLRTLAAPDRRAVHALKRAARALHVDWPDGAAPGDVLARVDRSNAEHVAFIEHAASLLRGAGYVAFDGNLPEHDHHAGIGAPYAHVTAPLRRLVDRYATEACLAIRAERPVPAWARSQLAGLPQVMQTADQLAHRADRAVVDMTEAWLLQDRVGQVFGAGVIDADAHAATVMLDEPPVRARCSGANLRPGAHIAVRLIEANVATRSVRFEAL